VQAHLCILHCTTKSYFFWNCKNYLVCQKLIIIVYISTNLRESFISMLYIKLVILLITLTLGRNQFGVCNILLTLSRKYYSLRSRMSEQLLCHSGSLVTNSLRWLKLEKYTIILSNFFRGQKKRACNTCMREES